jgi:hypothetical protein
MKFCLSVAKQKLQLLLTPEDLEAAKAGRCMSTLEPVSGQVGLCFPGKVIFGGRDRTAITSVEAPCEKSSATRRAICFRALCTRPRARNH